MLAGSAVGAQQISIAIDRIEGSAFAARKISGRLNAASRVALDLNIGELEVAGQRWRDLRVHCPDLIQDRDELACARGELQTPVKMPLTLRYSTTTSDVDVTVTPAANEEWRITVAKQSATRTFIATVKNGLLARLAPWWPAGWPKPNAGNLNGKVMFLSNDRSRASADLQISNFGFSDASGSHAGEKIVAALSLQAEEIGAHWQWQSRLEWKAGEVYWQPIFASATGESLTAAGIWDAKHAALDRGRLTLPGVGNVDLSATFNRTAGQLATARISATDVAVAGLYEKLLKPMVAGTVAGDLRSDGRADIVLEIKGGTVASADLTFRRVSVEDKSRRYALFGLSGRLPWQRDQLTSAKLHVEGGEILKVPFGSFDLPLEMRGIRLRTQNMHIPVFDGKLIVKDFATTGEGTGWRWRFTGAVEPVSMERLTTAFGWPVMHGTLSASIPTVTYQPSTLKIDGALLFRVFDGTIVAHNLVAENPLGQVPRLEADVEMRNLDLDLLTRTFSFGSITGRVDADIKDLELVNWSPVRFDARVASSPGKYPRRISQAAVQNISALGGAGAGAAIQRSFLRFFREFGYSALGLSCKLDSGVCRMGGIDETAQGYVIVKGGGIPAITVLGYNRNVGWHELIERLKRVTEDNVSPIVK